MRGKGKGRKRTLAHPLVPLVGEVGEGEVAVDEVVEDEEAGVMAGTPLPETEHGRTRTKPVVAITIGNAAMTRWPVLDDPRGYTYSLYCLCLLMRFHAFCKY